MNYLIVHGGGPTAVINGSLYGVIKELQSNQQVEHIYGALGGMEAIYTENYVDFNQVSATEIEHLLDTPGSAIGTSRYPLEDEDYEKLANILHEQNINGVFLNGGNGTMNTCGKLSAACARYDISVIGIPKTMDNDIAVIDHSPGFGSAANYIANTVAEIAMDVQSLPIHVCIVETMGRNAGWLAGASALAKSDNNPGPDLIYTSERPFSTEKFLEDVEKAWAQKKGVVVVVSEGLVDEKGEPIVPPIFETGRSVYYGDVGAYLVETIIKELGLKARTEKPGLAGRADITKRSATDLAEAIQVGREAAKAILNNETNVMVGIMREDSKDYQVTYPLIPIEKVMLHEKKMPSKYINDEGNFVTEEYIEWVAPIVAYTPEKYTFFNK